MNEYYQKNKAQYAIRSKQWSQANPERNRAKANRWYRNNRFKRHGLRVTFTMDDMERMYLVQQGKCAICLGDFPDSKSIHVDHNHVTGQVRELLCVNCNRGIGSFRDNTLLLSKAIEYLDKWKQ